MNYSIAFLGLIFAFAAVYWIISGRKFYTGPLIEADIAEEDSGDSKLRDERGSSEEHSHKDNTAVDNGLDLK